MSDYIALPFNVNNPAKVTYILDRMVEHDSWWSDFQKGRRETAAAILANGLAGEYRIFEIWQDRDIVGLVSFTDIVPQVDAKFHPLFFDGEMSNALGKRGLALGLIDWAFRTIPLERLSAEIPEFRPALISYARKKLGFRYEGEDRTILFDPCAPRHHGKEGRRVTPRAGQAVLGSRKFRIVRYKGEWHDLILLSVTRDEFNWYLTSIRRKPLEPANG